jgi:hypothetical protein
MAATFKIITESLPERCELCHQSDCFDQASGYCSRCVALTLEYNNALAKLRPNIIQPKEMVVELRKAGLQITNTETLSTRIFSTVIGLLMVGLTYFLILPGCKYIMMEILNLPLAVISILYVIAGIISLALLFSGLWFIIFGLFSHRTVITANSKELHLGNEPWRWFPNLARSVRVDEIDQIYAKKNSDYWFQLNARLKNGQIIWLFDCDKADNALYLEQQLENYLNIADRPVDGELPRN